MREIVFSTDDTLPIRISYPDVLTPAEFEDLKQLVALWLRQLERAVDPEILKAKVPNG